MDLLTYLKNKRKEIAEREGTELFMILHNATLEETARVMPKNKEELGKIKGWGKKKIEKYGDEILAVLTGNCDNNTRTLGAKLDKGIFTVGEFVEFINQTLGSLGLVKIQGELSEIDNRGGNVFFTLKDSSGRDFAIKCFMWRWDVEYFNHFLEDGLEVIVRGPAGLYKKGNFNITVKSIEPVGEGAIKKAFEALKKKLASMGYFDESRKRPIPEFVKTIGIITSETGEAINDFKKNLGQYGFKLNFLDVRVEGDYAETAIIKALKWFNLYTPDLDVIVLIRGGGSLENLKIFNSEKIAEAMVSSRIPIITGIGHEGDETIADYVADKRCSTPTAVAVFLRNQRENLISKLELVKVQLAIAQENLIKNFLQIISRNSEQLVFAFEKNLTGFKFALLRLSEKAENGLVRIFEKFSRLGNLFSKRIYFYENKTIELLSKIETIGNTTARLFEKNFELLKSRINTYEGKILSLNPEAVLQRGYSIVYGKNYKIIKTADETNIGESISITLSKGKLKSKVEEIEERA